MPKKKKERKKEKTKTKLKKIGKSKSLLHCVLKMKNSWKIGSNLN